MGSIRGEPAGAPIGSMCFAAGTRISFNRMAQTEFSKTAAVGGMMCNLGSLKTLGMGTLLTKSSEAQAKVETVRLTSKTLNMVNCLSAVDV